VAEAGDELVIEGAGELGPYDEGLVIFRVLLLGDIGPGDTVMTLVDPTLDLREELSKMCLNDPRLELLDCRDKDGVPPGLLTAPGDTIFSGLSMTMLSADRGVTGSTRGLTLDLLRLALLEPWAGMVIESLASVLRRPTLPVLVLVTSVLVELDWDAPTDRVMSKSCSSLMPTS
jgi:hypothetical protein